MMTTTTTTMTTTMTMMMTTSRHLPLRSKTVLAIVLTSAIGLVAVILATTVVQLSGVTSTSNATITQEVDEFRHFAELGVDPYTGQSFTDPEDLLEAFLARQRVAEGEVLMGHVDGLLLDRRGPRTPTLEELDLHDHPELLDAILAEQTGVAQTPAGRVRWGRLDITTPQGRGDFVVLQFTDVQTRNVFAQTRMMSGVGLLSLVLTGLIAWLLANRLVQPLWGIQRTASQISERDLSQRLPVRGGEELSSIAITFNSMLDRLEKAFAQQKQFVDDAGHELRTPITVIRGHLEVMGEDPEDREATMAVVNGELDRMARIVSDLLALAKADRPDYVRIPEEPVDVADLTMDIDARVQTMADRIWMVGHVADGPARIDSERVIQAVLQLAQNAIQHTEDGQTITVASSFVDGPDGKAWVEFSVSDTGAGVADEDRDRLFERFVRGSGDNARTGAGLGLAIVKAIVDGHDGTVGVGDTPGGGATFRLAMPRRCDEDGHQGSGTTG